MLSQKAPADAEILLSVTGVFCGILQYVSGGRGRWFSRILVLILQTAFGEMTIFTDFDLLLLTAGAQCLWRGFLISVLPDSGLVGTMPIVRQNKKFPYPFLRHIDKAAACMI